MANFRHKQTYLDLCQVPVARKFRMGYGDGRLVMVEHSRPTPHPDNVENLTVDESMPWTSDHATMVAGILGADDNDDQVVGVAPGAMIHAYTTPGDVDLELLEPGDIITASIDAHRNADFIAMTEQAYEQGVAVFCAAGNDPIQIDHNPSKAFLVSGTQSNGLQRAFFVPWGKAIDFCAPCTKVWTHYHEASAPVPGTSFSTPIVSGCAMVLQSIRKRYFKKPYSVDDLGEVMASTGYAVIGGDEDNGWKPTGRVPQLNNALRRMFNVPAYVREDRPTDFGTFLEELPKWTDRMRQFLRFLNHYEKQWPKSYT